MTGSGEQLSDLERCEADRLARYLIGHDCPPDAALDYFRAIETHQATLPDAEQKLWERMLRSPSLLRCIDAGLAVTSPSSVLRKRIFIMLCILETEPSFVHHFLPRDRSRFHVLTIGIRSVRALAAAFAGVLLTKILRVV